MSHHRVYLYKGCALLNFISNICNHTYSEQQLPTDVCDDSMERGEKNNFVALVLLVIVMHMHEYTGIGVRRSTLYMYMRSVEGLHGIA